jgi:DNA-binding transcriptional LysR family regulator
MTQWLCAQVGQIATEDIQLHFIAADHNLDIARREAVIGLRNHRPQDIGLAGRKVGQVHFAGYACAPDLPWIKVSGQTPSAKWLADQPGRLSVSAPRNALDLARAGQGTALLPTFIGDDTSLTKITDIAELTHDQWLVCHDTARFQPQVRRVINNLTTALTKLHRAAP